MKGLAVVVAFTMAALSPVAAQTPPDQPWFSDPLVKFLDNPQVTALGWSHNGKVALLVPVDEGGRGGPVVRLLFLDTVEDKVIFDEEIWGDEFDVDYDETGMLVRNMEESDKGQSFIEACYDGGMQPADLKSSALSPFPLRFENSVITAKAVVQPRSEEDDFGSRAVDYRIVVAATGRGEKTVAKAHDDHVFDVTISGYLLSPFEPRIVVVYGVTHPGFEGERPTDLSFSGSHLRVGFTNP